MARDYQSISKKLLARGLDQFSARASVREGYAEDLVNVDTNASGSVATRTGYEGYYGWLPWRVKSVQAVDEATDKLRFTLQGADLSNAKVGPLVVYGKAPANVGDFNATTSTARYYSGFRVLDKVALTVGTPVTLTKTADEHGQSSALFAAGLYVSDSAGDRDNNLLTPDLLKIDQAAYDLRFDYTVGAAADAFLVVRNLDASLGTRYHWTFTGESAAFTASGDTLTDVAHGLSVDDVVEFTTTGTLPGNLSPATLYYVVSVPTADTFKVSATEGGTAITTSGAGSGTHTWHRRSHTVAASTHNLSNFNIVPFFFQDDGTHNVAFVPAEFTVDNSGEVRFIYGPGASDMDGTVVLEAADTDNTATDTVNPGGVFDSFLISAPFTFPAVYFYDAAAGRNILVLPGSWTYTESPGTLDMTYTTGVADEVRVFWVAGSVLANTIEVESITAAGTTTLQENPQLTLWGLDHEGNYAAGATKGGHVAGLDSYRTADETRLLASLGGVLCASQTFEEASSTYLLEKKYNRNVSRIDRNSGLKAAPLFHASNPGSVRNRGVVYDTTVQNNRATVSAATYISSGVVDYTLSFTSKTGTLALGTQVDVGDWLTVSNMAHDEHAGTWQIVNVTDGGATFAVFRVSNAAITSAAFNEVNAGGSAGVFTDRLVFENKTLFIPGDTLLTSATEDFTNIVKTVTFRSVTFAADAGTDTLTSSAHRLYDGDRVRVSSSGTLPGGLAAATDYYVTSATPSTFQLSASQGGSALDLTTAGSGTHTLTLESGVVYADGFDDAVTLPDGLQVTALRESALVPIGDIASNADFDYVVRGDMLVVELAGEELARRVRVLGVQTRADQTVTVASGVFTSPLTHRLNVGDTVLLSNSTDSDLVGEFIVESVPTTTTFTLEDVDTASGTATLYGSMLLLDEALTTQGGVEATTFKPEGRWIPVEAPASTFSAVDSINYRYFDTLGETSQEPIRSTSLGNKTYFTNGYDEVLTYDGDSIYRAGLPRWQPFLFVQNDTSSSSNLTQDKISAPTSGSATYLHSSRSVSSAYNLGLEGFTVGDSVAITYSGTTIYAAVQKVAVGDNSTATIVTLGNFSADASSFNNVSVTLSSAFLYKYYFRLQYIDSQDNVISSAMTGANDCIVRYSGAGAIELKLVGLPLLDNYDYDRITVEVYRTLADGTAFYFVTTKEVSFANGAGYVLITDVVADEILEARKDVDTLSVLKGGVELGTGWQQPIRAKYISSAGGRLILANLQDYYKAVLNFEATGAATEITAANLVGSSKKITFRKDNTDTSTTTNMIDRATFEFVNSSSVTITNITESSGTATVTAAGHGLAAGDWVYLFRNTQSTNNRLQYAGWHHVAAVAGNDFTFKVSGTFVAFNSSYDTNKLVKASSGAIPVWLGTDGNYNNTMNQASTNYKFRAGVFLANAINACMRQTNTAISGMSTFVPWLTASAGSDYSEGEVVVQVTKNLDTTPEVATDSGFASSYDLYVNDSKLGNSEAADFEAKKFPSRALLSYPNYAEIFDNPTAVTNDYSDSVVDVNPEDGQEITAVLPFFGVSNSGAAQLSQKVIFFKTNSVYSYDIESGALTKLDSRGLGCTSPASVANGRNAAFFANESGVCRLNRDDTVDLMVDLSKLWKTSVNRDALAVAAGHHYSVGRRYKLSVPAAGEEANSLVLVYDYEPEDRGEPGGWARYTNHPATVWCNLAADAFWGSTQGDVFLVRNRGESSDFRDEDQAVAEAEVLLRAEDFGVPGLRKVVQNVITFLDLETTALDDLRLYAAMDLSTNFVLSATVSKALGDPRHFRTSLSSRRGNYIQLKYKHQTKDQQMVLASLAYSVGQLNYKLTREAAQDG